MTLCVWGGLGGQGRWWLLLLFLFVCACCSARSSAGSCSGLTPSLGETSAVSFAMPNKSLGAARARSD